MAAVFYPACKLRFQIRFEDYTRLPPPPAAGIGPNPTGAEGFGPGMAEQLAAFNSAGMDIVPYTATVEVNSYRVADTARASIPFKRLPFDPRIIRAATVQIFGGTFTPAEFAEANGLPESEGLLLPDVVPFGRSDQGESNELFRGFVDEWKVTLGGEDTLDITARDLTGPLLDAEIPESFLRDLPNGLPLDQLIQLLLTGDGGPTPETSRRFGLPGFRGIQVVNEVIAEGTDPDLQIFEPMPTMIEFRPPSWYDSKKTATKGRRKEPGQGKKMSYWDAITDIVTSAGYIVYMRPGQIPVAVPGIGSVLPATEIVITNPRTYYTESRTGVPTVDLDAQRVFVYGLNVEELVIERKLGGVKAPAIEVRSFDPTLGQRLTARWPPLSVNNRPTLGPNGDREEVKTFNMDEISGPKALERLVAAAKSIYEQLGRGEMTIAIRTKHMAGLLSNLDDGIVGDLLRLRAGDPISVEVDTALVDEGRVSAYTLFTNKSPAERLQAMIADGVDESIATLAVLAMASPFIQTEFRTQRVSMNFDHSEGWDFSIRAINYLDVRHATGFVPS